MEDYFDQDKAKALVYLLAEGDDKNKAMISDEKLMVIQKGGKRSWDLNTISMLKTENKKLLFPLILGGIISPLAFLSFFANLFHPWFHLLTIMGGLFLLYFGWVGKSVLTIVFRNNNELNYYLSSISHNLSAFIDYVNMLQNKVGDESLRDLLFFEKKHESMLFGSSTKLEGQEIFPIFGYTYKQTGEQGKSLHINNMVIIDPSKTGREIKFEYDLDSGQMRPKLEGPILASSKVKV